MSKRKMTLKDKLRSVTRTYGALKYVPIKTGGHFILFKVPRIALQADQKPVKKKFEKDEFPKFDRRECAIYHGSKLYIRWQNQKVEGYLSRYRKEIDNADEYTTSNFFDLCVDEKKFERKIDPLFYRKKIGITVDKRSFKEIIKFLRSIDHFKDNRHNRKLEDKFRIKLVNLVRKRYEKLKLKPSTRDLKDWINDFIDGKCSEDSEKAEKYHFSDKMIKRCTDDLKQ